MRCAAQMRTNGAMGNGWGARQRRERGLRSEVRERVYSVMRAASIGLTVDTRGRVPGINGTPGVDASSARSPHWPVASSVTLSRFRPFAFSARLNHFAVRLFFGLWGLVLLFYY